LAKAVDGNRILVREGVRFIASVGLPKPLFVKGDEHRISQILNNLLSNSSKFTKKGEIELTVSKGAETEDSVEVQFSVRDTGIGISDEVQRILFKPFTQVRILL
jgi:two-component system, NarL family, sensor histidine kinase BarA